MIFSGRLQNQPTSLLPRPFPFPVTHSTSKEVMRWGLHLSPIILKSPCLKGAGGTSLRSAYPRLVEKPLGGKPLRTVQGDPIMMNYTTLSNVFVFVWDHGYNKIPSRDDMAHNNAILTILHFAPFGAFVYLTSPLLNEQLPLVKFNAQCSGMISKGFRLKRKSSSAIVFIRPTGLTFIK